MLRFSQHTGRRMIGLAIGAVMACGQAAWAQNLTVMPIGQAWARNSVNVTIFRNDPITTAGDQQFAAYYNEQGNVVIAQRKLGETDWKTTVTALHGHVQDAHNDISLIADGELGDPNPVEAVRAVVERDGADAYSMVLVSTLPRLASRWLRLDVPSRIARATGLRVHHVEAPARVSR